MMLIAEVRTHAQSSVIAFNAMIPGAAVVEVMRLLAGFAPSEPQVERLAFSTGMCVGTPSKRGSAHLCDLRGFRDALGRPSRLEVVRHEQAPVAGSQATGASVYDEVSEEPGFIAVV